MNGFSTERKRTGQWHNGCPCFSPANRSRSFPNYRLKLIKKLKAQTKEKKVLSSTPRISDDPVVAVFFVSAVANECLTKEYS